MFDTPLCSECKQTRRGLGAPAATSLPYAAPSIKMERTEKQEPHGLDLPCGWPVFNLCGGVSAVIVKAALEIVAVVLPESRRSRREKALDDLGGGLVRNVANVAPLEALTVRRGHGQVNACRYALVLRSQGHGRADLAFVQDAETVGGVACGSLVGVQVAGGRCDLGDHRFSEEKHVGGLRFDRQRNAVVAGAGQAQDVGAGDGEIVSHGISLSALRL